MDRGETKLRHYCGELGDVDPAALGGVVVREELQHEPVELNILGASHVGHGLLDEGLVLLSIAVVNDGLNERL